MRTETNRRGRVGQMLQEALMDLSKERQEHFAGMYDSCLGKLTTVANWTKSDSTLNKYEALHVLEAVMDAYVAYRTTINRSDDWALTPWQLIQLALYIDSRA